MQYENQVLNRECRLTLRRRQILHNIKYTIVLLPRIRNCLFTKARLRPSGRCTCRHEKTGVWQPEMKVLVPKGCLVIQWHAKDEARSAFVTLRARSCVWKREEFVARRNANEQTGWPHRYALGAANGYASRWYGVKSFCQRSVESLGWSTRDRGRLRPLRIFESTTRAFSLFILRHPSC